ncbi:MAG TPA: adenosine kinase [Bacteroidales bacterium]
MIRLLGMGNALTDVLMPIGSDDILLELGLPKGSMQLINLEQFERISARVADFPKHFVCGGSAANTITGASKLGVKSVFIGKVFHDEVGLNYKEDLNYYGVDSFLLEGKQESGQSLVFVSQDGQRTFATFLGAAADLLPEDIKPEFFQDSTLFYIEGYLLQNHELILKAVKMAREGGLKVALDLASYNVVEDNLEFLKELITSHVDIVFANEEEAKALTGLQPAEALESIAAHVEIAVVKIGAQGAMAIRGNERVLVPAMEANCIDTTGAGDLFAAGFIYGMSIGLSLADCTRYGTITAGKVVEVIGPKMTNDHWTAIHANF